MKILDAILKEYDDSKIILNNFNDKMVVLISELLMDKDIQVHQIIGRLKERDSLEKKILQKKDKYLTLKDITDISGLRIITYMESDVDTVASLIEGEFVIDKENSIDKRKLKSDQFECRSLHYVLECSDNRTRLREYKRFKKLKFEIQIRSILQHAWAEIEHDLGYKSEVSVPETYRRGFNRVAALLETADFEFERLKKELKKYESDVSILIKKEPNKVSLNQASLSSFNQTNEILEKARTIIKKNMECQFVDSNEFGDYIKQFKDVFNLNTIDQVDKLLKEHEKVYLTFVDLFTKNKKYSDLLKSIPLFYFQHFLSAVDEDQNSVDFYVHNGNMTIDQGEFIEIVKNAKTITEEL